MIYRPNKFKMPSEVFGEGCKKCLSIINNSLFLVSFLHRLDTKVIIVHQTKIRYGPRTFLRVKLLASFFLFAPAMSLWICTCMMIISPAKRKSWTERTHIWKYFPGEMEKRNWDQSTPYSSLALQLSTHDKSVEFAHLF